jgi:hypothetical protein
MEITLNLSESVYRGVSAAARKSKRPVIDLIVDVVKERYAEGKAEGSLRDYSDEEVLALANLQMPKRQSLRHSQLLHKNQTGLLTPKERTELAFFQQVYGIALMRKAEGVYEAVQRKLIRKPADLTDA